jgi:hypothetical protein
MDIRWLGIGIIFKFTVSKKRFFTHVIQCIMNGDTKVERIYRRPAFILASAKKKNYFIVARI